MSQNYTIIAGPCMAESYSLLDETAAFLKEITQNKTGGSKWNLIFKASFDKANRSSLSSTRGPGMEQSLTWFQDIKAKYNLSVITDIHESYQAKPVSEVCDYVQIPAFLCRQTDLLQAAAETNAGINIKKGQFIGSAGMHAAAQKCKDVWSRPGQTKKDLFITERGNFYGYGDLVVDMRNFKQCAEIPGAEVIFDATHSVQRPPSHMDQSTTGADRHMIPMLTRCALASGYVSGLFTEVHPRPNEALSDKESQLDYANFSSLFKEWDYLTTCMEKHEIVSI